MPDFTSIEFNRADHRQRKAVRVALAAVFGGERVLAMFLDEELDIEFREVVEKGPFKAQVHDLVRVLMARGKLDDLMEALYTSDEFKDAPALRDLLIAWDTVSVAADESAAPSRARDSASAPEATLERILNGEVTRMKPISLLAGIATLRRRVCRLETGSTPVATGFLIGPELILTAAYAVQQAVGEQAHGLEARFDFGIDHDRSDEGVNVALGSPLVIDPASSDPAVAEDYLDSLDYAVLPLAKRIGEEKLGDGLVRGWFDLTNARERLRQGELAFMLHHPRGGPMVMSEGALGGHHEADARVAHSCGSEPGSGGAPLVDATLRLIGLHEMQRLGETARTFGQIAVRADRIARSLAEHGIEVVPPPGRD